MKIIRIVLIVAILSFPALAWGMETIAPGDFPAKIWLASPKGERISYLIGFMAGINVATRMWGYELVQKRGKGVTYETMDKIMYRELLNHPYLMEGDIGSIILHTFNDRWTFEKRP
jgi:hypothetical protein